MGFYIEAPSNLGKGEWLAETFEDAEIIPQPENFSDVPEGKFLICIVNNGPFEAVCILYDEREFTEFTDTSDTRPKSFLLLSEETTFRLNPKLKGFLGVET